jgi:hypothetical protein
MNLFLGYLKIIIWPRSALCHLILDIRCNLYGVPTTSLLGTACSYM